MKRKFFHARGAKFPMQQFVKVWQKGLASAFVPKTYGGAGFSMKDTHEVRHQLQTADKTLRPILAAQYKAQIALQFSDKKHQQKLYFSLMTQNPTIAGSVSSSFLGDVTPQATFHKMGDEYVLNGTSIPYTNANVASFYVVEASPSQAGGSHDKQDNVVFLVDKHRLGIHVEAPDGSMTLDELSHTRKVSFHAVRVSADAVVGAGKEISSLMSAMLDEVM